MFGLAETGSLGTETAHRSSWKSPLCTQYEELEYAKHIIFCCYKTTGWEATLECKKLLTFHDKIILKIINLTTKILLACT
jgi:hypothetical protein